MSGNDRLAVIQAEESVKELKKIIEESKRLVSVFKDVKKSADDLNKSFKTGKLKDYADGIKNINTVSREFVNLQNRVSSQMERLSRVELNNARAAAENARARRDTAAAIRDEDRTRQQLARQQRQNASESNSESSAYKRLQRETRETRLRARDYGAEIIALRQKYKQGQISSRDYSTQIAELKKNFRLSTNEAIRLERELRRLNQSTLPSNQRNGALGGRVTDIIKGLGIFSLAQSGISALTNAVQKLGVEFYNTAVKLETLRFSQKAVFKTNEEVKNQNIFLTDIANKYGLEIMSLTDSYTKFSASAQGTTLEGAKTKEIFDAVTKSSAMLGVSTDDTNGILRALGQMMSKGKVQAEELRGQLGDRMAGAFRLFADGMGVSTAELDKMLKDGKVITEDVLPKFAAQLNKKYELGFGEEIDTKQASLARLKNEWVDFVDAVETKSGIVSKGISAVSDTLVSLLQALKPSKEITVIEQQQEQFNLLGIELRQNWKDQNRRKELIDEMIALNPFFLNGLDREKATLEDISKRIQDVNGQYIQKLILQEQDEKIAELYKDQAENYKDLAKIIRENAVEYNSFNSATKSALDEFSIGSLKYKDAETRIINSTRAGTEERRKAISMLDDMNKIYTNSKGVFFNYVRGINDNTKAIKEEIGVRNDMVNVTNRLLGVQGQLLNMNGLLAKSYKGTGEVVYNRKKQIDEELKAAEGMGKNIALVSNVWREKVNGKWTTTNKKQTDGWYEENGKLVLRKPYQEPPKETKPKAASLTPAEKDFVNKATGIRDAELASLKERKLDLLINEEEYWTEYEKIYENYSNKIQNYIKGANAKQIQVEGSVYRKAIDARELATKERYDKKTEKLENQYKLETYLLEKHSKDLEKADFLTDSEKLQKQIDIDSQLIQQTEKYYNKQIDLAKKMAQPVLVIERKRDEEIGRLQDARFDKLKSRVEVYSKDLERQASIDTSKSNISVEEQKRAILADKRLTANEKAYRISLLDIDKQIEANQIEIKRLKTLKAQYDVKVAMAGLEGKTNPVAEETAAKLQEQIVSLENANTDLNNQAKSMVSDQAQAIQGILAKGFGDLGFTGLADAYTATMDRLKGKTMEWRDFAVLAASAVLDSLTKLNERQKERTIANLDEQLKHSQQTTEQEIGFIDKRLGYLNNLDELSKEQLSERNRLEDEARTYKEQQLQREKLIATQKAKAEQKAAAQQALINGALAATQTLAQLGFIAGAIPAALALAFGIAQSIAISSKNPVPQYWVGRKDGKAEFAWTQEKGREIIADKKGNIKSLGSDGGAKMTWLDKGDVVYTASETAKMLKNMDGLPKIGQNIFRRAAMKSIQAPIIIQQKQEDYSQKIIDGLAAKMESIFKRNSNPEIQYIKGKIIQYHGANNPVVRGEYDLKTGEETWY